MQENSQKQAAFDAAVKLIKDDGPHGFRIDIEADSTIAPDEQAEKQMRVEFLSEMIPMLNQVVPFAQGNPPLAALAKEMTLFAVRGFRVGRQLEETFEKAFDAIGKMQPNPKVSGEPQGKGDAGPHPAEIASTVAVKGHEIDTKAQIAQMQTAQKASDAAADRRLEALKIAGQHDIEQQHLMLDIEKAGRDAAHKDVLAGHRLATDAARLT